MWSWFWLRPSIELTARARSSRGIGSPAKPSTKRLAAQAPRQ
jgi:hypothetical protein